MATHSGLNIVRDGLVTCIDPANNNCYTSTGSTSVAGTITNIASRDRPAQTGTAYNGVTHQPATAKGTFIFDGTDDRIAIEAPDSIFGKDYTQDITLFAWAKPDIVSGWRTVLGTSSTFRQIGFYGGSFYYGGNAGGGNSFGYITGISAGNWYCIAMSASGTSATGYLNMNSATANIGNNSYTISHIQVGSYSYSGGELFDGNIGICLYYNRALTEDEIRQNFNATRGRYGV